MDKSNGYEEIAEHFLSARSQEIGASIIRAWSKTLARGSSVLDLGCGDGVPVSQVLEEEGLQLYGIDASATLIASYRTRFPGALTECAAFEDSDLFSRKFDGVVAVGLIFLLLPDLQSLLIQKAARALHSGGKILFSSPTQVCNWKDLLTHRPSTSLGAERYREMLLAEGLVLVAEMADEAGNHFYSAEKR